MPKGIHEIKTQKKLKFIQTNNNNSNRTFLKDYTNNKNDSKGSSVKLKKRLNYFCICINRFKMYLQ